MDMADEVDVGGQVRQDALAAVGAISRDHDLVVGKPGGDQGNEFDGQLRAGAVVGGRFGSNLLGLVFLAFGQALAVAIQAHGNGQGEDLGRGPEGVDDKQTQDDPIVSPTDQGFGATGDEGVVVHASAVEGQA